MRDKQVMDTLAKFSHLPSGYVQEINRLLAWPGSTMQELTKTVRDLEQVWLHVVSLDGAYAPKFQI